MEEFKLLSQEMLELDVKLASEQFERQQAEPMPDMTLPESVTIMCSPIKHQGALGACTGFATVAGVEALVYKKFGLVMDLSELCNYHLAKEKDPWEGTNYSGSSITSSTAQARDVGTCHEKLKPYANSEYQFITNEQNKDANHRRLSLTKVLPINVQAIQNELALDRPVVFSIQMYSGFNNTNGGFVKPLGDKISGGHAVLCCGYFKSENQLWFIIKNSWGQSYGNQGFCYICEKDLFKNKMLQVAVSLVGLIPEFKTEFPLEQKIIVEPAKPKPEPLEPEKKENFISIFIKKIIEIIINVIKKG